MEIVMEIPQKKVSMIRHAKSEWNAWNTTEWPESIPITLDGTTASEELASTLEWPISTIIHTHYLRTEQTAAPFIEKFPDAKKIMHPCAYEFAYLDSELYKNTTMDQRATARDDFWSNNDMNHKETEKTESVKEFVTRVLEFKKYLIDIMKSPEHNKVIIFGHGLFMRMLLDILRNSNYNIESESKSRVRKVLQNKEGYIENLQVIDLTEYIVEK